jgi:dihydrofolate reductase
MVVITHNKAYQPKGCIVVSSVMEALRVAEKNHENEVFIIGGGEVFKQAIGFANKIYLTTVHVDADADVFFPKIDFSIWEIIRSEFSSWDENDDYESDFKILIRNNYKWDN